MASTRSVIPTLQAGYFLASIDVKDAFLHMTAFLHQYFSAWSFNMLKMKFLQRPKSCTVKTSSVEGITEITQKFQGADQETPEPLGQAQPVLQCEVK